jgi:tetratricopeptide (TPR) repeat protein
MDGTAILNRILHTRIAHGALGWTVLGSLAVAAPPAQPGVTRPAGAVAQQSRATLPEHVTRECRRRLDYAISLAERGAVMSARGEAISALHLLAGARGQSSSTASIDQALQLLFDESAQADADSLKKSQESFQRASGLLAQSFGRSDAASDALFTLGRLQTMPQAALAQDERFASARAMALHLAALQCNPENAAAAHELGTLFAFYGQLPQAAHWLEKSALSSNQPATWENLAAVYERMGRTGDSQAARKRSEIIPASATTAPAVDVTWVDPAAFATLNGANDGVSALPAANQTAAQAAAPAVKENPTPRGPKFFGGFKRRSTN